MKKAQVGKENGRAEDDPAAVGEKEVGRKIFA